MHRVVDEVAHSETFELRLQPPGLDLAEAQDVRDESIEPLDLAVDELEELRSGLVVVRHTRAHPGGHRANGRERRAEVVRNQPEQHLSLPIDLLEHFDPLRLRGEPLLFGHRRLISVVHVRDLALALLRLASPSGLPAYQGAHRQAHGNEDDEADQILPQLDAKGPDRWDEGDAVSDRSKQRDRHGTESAAHDRCDRHGEDVEQSRRCRRDVVTEGQTDGSHQGHAADAGQKSAERPPGFDDPRHPVGPNRSTRI